MTNRVSRLAPSPTGALHLGNVRTFLVNWALARRGGWTLTMRVEDLDGPRVKPESAPAMLETLRWLGIDHDGPPLVQSHDLTPYRRAMSALGDGRSIYSCHLTRREIAEAASAPHAPTLRRPTPPRPEDPTRYRFEDEDTNYRLAVPDEKLRIDDEFAGASEHRPHEEAGDFVVWTKAGVPAYQLAVVVDDLRQGVTDVVRGADLLASAARQVLVYRALGARPPRWWHLPLVLGPDGRRLAKRHGDTRIDEYRAAGVAAERIIGLMAWWCGVTSQREDMTATDFLSAFDIERMPREPVVYGVEDERWLRGEW